MDLQLPYPAPLPSWSSLKHPSVIPRPFLTPHPTERHLFPRLFPVQLNARALYRDSSLCDPAVAGCDTLEDTITNERRLSSAVPAVPGRLLSGLDRRADESPPLPLWRIAPRNAMCAMNDGEDGDALVALTTTGRLDSVALWRGELHDNNSRDDFTRLPISRHQKEAFTDEVFDLIGAEDCGQGGLLAARLSRMVALGRFGPGGTDLNWVDRIPIDDGVCALTLSKQSMIELSTIDQFSFRVFDIATSGSVRRCRRADIQPFSQLRRFRWLRYAAHPRCLLLASRAVVSRIDLRMRIKAVPLLDVRKQLHLHKMDGGLIYFGAHPTHPFRSVLASETLVAVSDERLLKHPALEWNVPTGTALAGMGSSCTLGTRPSDDLVVAIADPVGSELSVLHATHGHDFLQTEDIIGPADSSLKLGSFRFQHPEQLWSDLPLRHLDRFGPRGLMTPLGLTLVRHPRSSRVSLLQAVPGRGVITQLLGVEPFEDGTHLFEPPPRAEDESAEQTAVPAVAAAPGAAAESPDKYADSED
eukprot:IDg15209t1